MKTTKASIKVANKVSIFAPDDVQSVHIDASFDLHPEDYDLLLDSRDFMNEHMGIEADTADHLLSLITWAIHLSYEERTGKPFTLRIDRENNKS